MVGASPPGDAGAADRARAHPAPAATPAGGAGAAGGAGEPLAHVDAVLLACDGARWLPEALDALAAQTRRPDRLLLADAGSRDASGAVMRAHPVAAGAPVVRLRRRTGVLDAARAAVAVGDADALVHPHAPGAPEVPRAFRWVWLLHDDAAPAPDALERLLAAVEVAPSVGVAGCKAVDWDDPGLLQQVGLSTTALGRRHTGLDHGDRDQGQRDHREDVLAVGTAGMLVRRDLLDALGGDPALPVLGEDVDLCRRARLAGSRVVVVPTAVVRHADATRAGLRATPASAAVRWTVRRHEAHARLAGAAAPALPLVALAVLAGGLARALARVAAKQPDRAAVELTAVLAALCSPRRVAAARRAARATAVLPRRSLRPLLVPRREVVRWHRDRWARSGWAPTDEAPGLLHPADEDDAALAGPHAGPDARSDVGHEDGSDVGSDAALDPRPDAAADAPAPAPPAVEEPAPRRGLGVLLPLLLALAAADVLALHRLVGPGAVVGGALEPAPSLGRLWAAARSSWQPAGLGAAATADPWLSLLAVLAAPLGASVTAAVLVLLLAALPLAGLGAWAAAGAATRSRALRAAAALGWAGAAPLLLATSSGRLGALAAHLALPWVALGLARAVTAPSRRPALAGAGLAGVAGAAAVAGAPLLLLPLLAALVVVAATARRWTGALVWAALAPLAAAGPLLVPALVHPGVLLLSPGAATAVGAPVPAWQLLLGVPAAPAGLPGALGALALAPGALALVGAVAALGSTRARAARTGWWVAGLGLLAAGAAARAAGTEGAWSGPGTSLVLAGLGAAALAGAGAPRPLGRAVSERSALAARQRARGALAATAAVALCLPAVALAGWVRAEATGAAGAPAAAPAAAVLHRDRTVEPAVAVDAARSPDAVRTLHLALAQDGSAAVAVRRGPLTLADASAVRRAAGEPAADPGATAVRRAAALLVTGSADPRAPLAALGVGWVLLEDPTAASTARLDGVPGLVRAGATGAGVLYRVLPASVPEVAGGGAADGDAVARAADRPARARLLAADGAVLAVLPSAGQDVVADVPAAAPGAPARTAVVAERAGAGWHAAVDGRAVPLTTADGWALAVEVPAAGGHLVVTRSDPAATAWAVLQALVLLLTALLAVPVPGRGRAR